MEQRNGDVGTKKDLMLYRLENAKSDLKSAKILFAAEEFIRIIEEYCMMNVEKEGTL